MNAIGGEFGTETQVISNRVEKERGQDAVALIETAAGAGSAAAQQLDSAGSSRFPPAQPVKGSPRDGSTLEVIA